MKIGILLSPYGIEKPSGLSRHILSLVSVIIKIYPNVDFVVFVKGKLEVDELKFFNNLKIYAMPDSIFWKDIALLRRKDINVWLYNNLSLPLLLKPNKSVTIAHDFGNFYSYEGGGLKRRIAIFLQKLLQGRAIAVSSRIICISNSTKDDLFAFFPNTDRKKVTTCYNGYDRRCDPEKVVSIEGLPENFYLLVGVIKSRKNQKTAVEAFIEAKSKGIESDLVITGKGGGQYFEDLLKLINTSEYSKSIHYMGYRTDAEIDFLYKHTKALIVPSRVEGFGMTIVEAMHCGTPVIISDNRALVEVAGNAAYICSVDSVKDFSDAMVKFEDKQFRDSYSDKGLLRSEDFSWEGAAKEYMQVLRSALLDI